MKQDKDTTQGQRRPDLREDFPLGRIEINSHCQADLAAVLATETWEESELGDLTSAAASAIEMFGRRRGFDDLSNLGGYLMGMVAGTVMAAARLGFALGRTQDDSRLWQDWVPAARAFLERGCSDADHDRSSSYDAYRRAIAGIDGDAYVKETR